MKSRRQSARPIIPNLQAAEDFLPELRAGNPVKP